MSIPKVTKHQSLSSYLKPWSAPVSIVLGTMEVPKHVSSKFPGTSRVWRHSEPRALESNDLFIFGNHWVNRLSQAASRFLTMFTITTTNTVWEIRFSIDFMAIAPLIQDDMARPDLSPNCPLPGDEGLRSSRGCSFLGSHLLRFKPTLHPITHLFNLIILTSTSPIKHLSFCDAYRSWHGQFEDQIALICQSCGKWHSQNFRQIPGRKKLRRPPSTETSWNLLITCMQSYAITSHQLCGIAH